MISGMVGSFPTALLASVSFSMKVFLEAIFVAALTFPVFLILGWGSFFLIILGCFFLGSFFLGPVFLGCSTVFFFLVNDIEGSLSFLLEASAEVVRSEVELKLIAFSKADILRKGC